MIDDVTAYALLKGTEMERRVELYGLTRVMVVGITYARGPWEVPRGWRASRSDGGRELYKWNLHSRSS